MLGWYLGTTAVVGTLLIGSLQKLETTNAHLLLLPIVICVQSKCVEQATAMHSKYNVYLQLEGGM